MDAGQIEFRFKGRRDYIHGTDMFNAMLDTCRSVGELRNIRFSVHEFVHAPVCRLWIANSKDEVSGVDGVRARCQIEVNGSVHWMALTELGGDQLTGGRYEYDEDGIVSLCRISEDGISLIHESPYTFIENIVAMNKHMHQQMFPEAPGKWIFTRVDLDQDCDAKANLSLKFRHNMNFRLTKSDILVDGQKIGDLYFSLMKS